MALLYDQNGRVIGFACNPLGNRKRTKPCQYCHSLQNLVTCDWKLPNNRTCDRAVCLKCSTRVAVNTDHCNAHADPFAKFHSNGREYPAKYKSICSNVNCRQRVKNGETILWFATGKLLCAACAELYKIELEKRKKENEESGK